MYRWNGSAGAARIEVKPLRPVVFNADLDFSVGGGGSNVDGETLDDGTIVFELTAAQVATLRSDDTAFLGLGTAHTRIPGAPDNQWGYRYRVTQAGGALPAVFQDDGGEEMEADEEGYLYSALSPFAGNTAFTQETILIK